MAELLKRTLKPVDNQTISWAQEIRRKARVLHDAAYFTKHHGTEEIKDPGQTGWRKSVIPPVALLASFDPYLTISQGFTLRAYQMIYEECTDGIVYGMPLKAPFPEPHECMVKRADCADRMVPTPSDALPHVMQAIERMEILPIEIEYFIASILLRELKGFGLAFEWHNETLISTLPWETPEALHLFDAMKNGSPNPHAFTVDAAHTPDSKESWAVSKEPGLWAPHTLVDEETITIVFHTFTSHYYQKALQYRDTYRRGAGKEMDLVPQSEVEEIAKGTGASWM